MGGKTKKAKTIRTLLTGKAKMGTQKKHLWGQLRLFWRNPALPPAIHLFC